MTNAARPSTRLNRNTKSPKIKVIQVSDIWDEVVQIVGNDQEDHVFKRLNDAVELLSIKGDWNPLIGYLDVCVSSKTVTLPREVETILSLNMAGTPAVARDSLFRFHLNGPGDCGPTIPYQWEDLHEACTFREIASPSRLVANCDLEADENCQLWVEGFDQNQNVIRTNIEGTWHNGYLCPVNRDNVVIPADVPIFSRITAVRKSQTKGPVRLTTIDISSNTGILIAVYQWDETVPKFRRIRLARQVCWIRIGFRKRSFKIQNQYDLIPLSNRQSILMALRSLKHYADNNFALGEACEATATRWLTERERTSNSPVIHPIEVHDFSPLVDSEDTWVD